MYDRGARFYRALEPLFLISPRARRKAVTALRLSPGDTVLEVGVGTGRNLPYLIAAVGASGAVIGVDASEGMLTEARKLVARRGWPNVHLLHRDAAKAQLSHDVDAVLFSLSYSVLPEPEPALARAWERLRPPGRLVVMDLGLAANSRLRVLDPIARALIKIGPGDPYSEPWKELAEYGPVEMETFIAGLYYVCSVEKPRQ